LQENLHKLQVVQVLGLAYMAHRQVEA